MGGLMYKAYKKIIAVLLVILFMTPFLQTASADDSGLCFTATNDNLLDLGSMASYSGGIVYVPAKVFSTFGVYYNYFDSKSTAMLYNTSKQIYFELTSGNSYDSYNNTYSVSATYKNGQIYVPVAWVCQYFGLYYSYIGGNGYGDIVRIKNGAEVLTDSEFLDAANSLMRSRYNEYYGMVTPVSPTPSQPVPSDEIKGKSVSLSFIGLPTDKMLDSLDNYSAKVCFFVTADEVLKSPDIIRQICGSGHSIGVYCVSSPENECEKTADLIFEAAQTRPVLMTSPAAIAKNAKAYADSNGYAYFYPAIRIPETVKYSSGVTSELEDISGYASVAIPITADTSNYIPYVLQYADANRITLLPLRETLV